jgi:hypothetical protein
MTRLPRPPESLGDLLRWARDTWNYLSEREDSSAPNTLLALTTRGSSRSGLEGGGVGEQGAPLQFKGQWLNGVSYSKDDIVIREKIPDELDDGTQAGTYIATSDTGPHDMPPGEIGGAAAVLSAYVRESDGAITNVYVDHAGSGYSINTQIVFTSESGSGAVAHVTVDADGKITDVVMDTEGSGYPGSGYTTPVTVAAVNPEQRWVDFALGRWQKLTFRAGNRKIVIDAGRDLADPSLTIFNDYHNEALGSVQIRLSDMASAGNKIVKLREISYCSSGVPVTAVFLCSEFY